MAQHNQKREIHCENECKLTVKQSSELGFDDILVRIGQISRKQWLWALVALLGGANIAFHNSVIQYIIERPTHFWCLEEHYTYLETKSNLVSGVGQTCQKYGKNCSQWNADISKLTLQRTIVTDWSLYCTPAAEFALVEGIFLVAAGFGMALNGVLSDKFGRKSIVIVCTVMEMLTGIAQALCPNMLLFLVFRCMNGFFVTATYSVGYILATEMVGPKWRATMACVSALYFELLRIVCGLLALFLTDWKTLMIVGSCIDIPIVIALVLFTVESPRWLLESGQHDRALELFKQISKSNKTTLPGEIFTHIKKPDESIRGNVLDLIRTKHMRTRTVELWYSFVVLTVIYFDLNLTTDSFSTSTIRGPIVLIIYSIVTALVVVPLNGPLLDRLGRQWTHAGTLLMATGALATIPFVRPDSFSRTMLGTTAMISMTFVFYTCYTRATELLPTQVRNVGFGSCAFVGYCGSFLFPYINLFSHGDMYWFSSTVYATLTLSGALIALHLPETKDRALPDTIEDIEHESYSYM